jgi:hypothetical protein
MKSLYFDDSLYENEMHYKISKYLDELENDPDEEGIRIICNDVDTYNHCLDDLTHATNGKFKMYGVSYNPMEIKIEKDPREGYRKFNEEEFLMKDEDNNK